MLINYSTTDLDSFISKAESKIVSLGETLVEQLSYGDVEECVLAKIELLSYILDEIEQGSQEEIDVLVYFALDYFNLHEIPYSPFIILPTTIINTGGTGGGVSSWNDLLDKPSSFLPSPHTHVDNDILINLTGITETVGGITPGNYTGTLEEFLTQMLIKYQKPVFTSFTQDRGAVFEIGQTISGTMNLAWSISNSTNVKNDSSSGSLTLSETNPFTANLPFNLYGATGKSLLFSTPYTKTVPGTFTIYLNGVTSSNISMNQPSVSLTWYSKIYYGNSLLTTIDEATIEGWSGNLTNSRGINFTIAGSGYKYVFIPDNINQTGIVFKDFAGGVVGFDVVMNTPVNKTIVNSQGVSLAGKLYRTKNSLGSALTVIIQ